MISSFEPSLDEASSEPLCDGGQHWSLSSVKGNENCGMFPAHLPGRQMVVLCRLQVI